MYQRSIGVLPLTVLQQARDKAYPLGLHSIEITCHLDKSNREGQVSEVRLPQQQVLISVNRIHRHQVDRTHNRHLAALSLPVLSDVRTQEALATEQHPI